MWVVVALLAFALAAASGPEAETPQQPEPRSTTVGMPGRIEALVLPGPELEVRPQEDRRAPVVLRIAHVYPHGTAFRYDLVYYGLEPGEYDLRDYLRRKDGRAADDLPPIPVTVRSLLAAGQVEPNRLAIERLPIGGGYRLAMLAGAAVWLAGLGAILLAGRRRKRSAAAAEQKPRSLAERLRPMVEEAIAGRLDEPGRAELERMLLAWWRERLGLHGLPAAEAIDALRRHDEAGALLRQLELWLHRPGTAGEVELAALLEPYRRLADSIGTEEVHSQRAGTSG